MSWDSNAPRMTAKTGSQALRSSNDPGVYGWSARSRGLVGRGHPEVGVGAERAESAPPKLDE
eukprot:3818122-Alexandrium_andersonii.AAC.1